MKVHWGPHSPAIPETQDGPEGNLPARFQLHGGGGWIRTSDTRIMIPLL